MASAKNKVTIFATDAELGEAAAREVFAGIQEAYLLSKNYILGCPEGRSPRSTYRALARLVAANRQSLRHLHIAMMDEYVADLPLTRFAMS